MLYTYWEQIILRSGREPGQEDDEDVDSEEEHAKEERQQQQQQQQVTEQAPAALALTMEEYELLEMLSRKCVGSPEEDGEKDEHAQVGFGRCFPTCTSFFSLPCWKSCTLSMPPP